MASRTRASSCSSATEDHHYARPHRCDPPGGTSRTLEQGQIDRREAAASAKARLVYPQQVQIAGRTRDLAMFNLAIDSKLRGCDVVRLKVEDVAPHGHAVDRAMVRQKKTGQPVKFEMTEQT